ncbi:MAG: HEAT repeat domain-containing protein [Nitrospiraceae bacterium]
MFVTAGSGFLLSLLVMCLVMGPLVAQAEERTLSDAEHQLVNRTSTLYVDAKSSTWRSRGRVSFPVVPSLRMKLQSAGFAVVQNQTDPHDLILKVEYREERGKQFRIDLYGTDIAFVASLEHPTERELLRLTIRESSGLTESGNAPYVDVLHKFETNPYFYFLGEIIKGLVVSRRDTTGSLIESLQRLEEKKQPIFISTIDDGLPSAWSSIPTFETHYARLARENTIQELGRLQDSRAVPVLTTFLEHSDPSVRLASVRALESIREPKSWPALQRAAEQDLDHDVRAAAKAALATLPGF